MLPNTTSGKARLEGETYQEMQWWQEYAEDRAKRMAKAVAALRKEYDFKTRKSNEPEHPRKKKRIEGDIQQTVLETPALTRTPERFWRPQPVPTTTGCTCCGDQVFALTRAAVHTLNASNAQVKSVQPYDPHSRVRKWLKETSIWWYKEADTDNAQKFDQGNNLAPVAWITCDGRRAP